MNSRDFLAVICANCPSYQVPVPDCPLTTYRDAQRPHEDSLAKLSDEQVEELIRSHFLCVCRKEGCDT